MMESSQGLQLITKGKVKIATKTLLPYHTKYTEGIRVKPLERREGRGLLNVIL